MADQLKGDERKQSGFLFLGNQLWLDFLNTKIKRGGEWVDLLSDFANLIRWLEEARVLDGLHAQEALCRWPDPSERETIVGRARSFREALRPAVESVTQAEAVSGEVVEAINDVLRHHCRRLELAFDGDKLVSRYVGEVTEPLHLLAPMAESAAQALSGDDTTLTRKCENPACVLHFHDTTKNHTRRWCSMETCGNRMKAAAHYRRVRAEGNEQGEMMSQAGAEIRLNAKLV